jgi:hypothetical protein
MIEKAAHSELVSGRMKNQAGGCAFVLQLEVKSGRDTQSLGLAGLLCGR